MSQLFGQQCHTSIGQSILQTLCNSFEFRIEIGGYIAVFLQQSQSAIFFQSRRFGCLEHRFTVYVIAFQGNIHNDRYARITHHTVGFISNKVPHGQFSLLLEDVEHRLSDVSLLFGMNNRHEWMCCTIGIPKRKGGIVLEVGPMHAAVSPTIISVDIAEHRGSKHRMIHRRIENAACMLVGSFDTDFTQFAVPFLIGLGGHLTEVPCRQFSLQISPSVFDTHSRYAHLYHQRRIEDTGFKHRHTVGFMTIQLHRLRELCHKIHLLILCPTRRQAESRYLRGRSLFVMALCHLIPADTLIQVQQHIALPNICRERISMKGHTAGSGEFHPHTRVKGYRIVARSGPFAPMRERHLFFSGYGRRQQSDVAQVSDSRSTKMHLSEAHHHRIAIMITRTPIPPTFVLSGPHLHHTIRHIGTEEHMSVSARTDQRVYILGIVLRYCCGRQQPCRHQSPHFFLHYLL